MFLVKGGEMGEKRNGHGAIESYLWGSDSRIGTSPVVACQALEGVNLGHTVLEASGNSPRHLHLASLLPLEYSAASLYRP